MTVFKVCCMRDASEADMAIAAGALAVGLVGEMPNGPGPISDEKIKDIAAYVHERHGDRIWTVLLTSRTDGDGIVDHLVYTGANTVQIVDWPEAGAYEKIRAALPDIRIMQVIHVEDESAIEQAHAASCADVILLDSGKPSAKVKTFGGTGDVHDWSVSKRIVEAARKPVFLAGGLDPQNVREAIAQVRPFGVDICSGLRDKADGYSLVAKKLNAFSAELSAVAD